MNKVKKCKYGLVAYDSDDEILGISFDYYGEFCDDTVKMLSSLINEDSVVLDIGSLNGAITIPLSKKVKKIYAFEQKLYYLLCSNVILNDITNVECYNNPIQKFDSKVDLININGNEEESLIAVQPAIEKYKPFLYTKKVLKIPDYKVYKHPTFLYNKDNYFMNPSNYWLQKYQKSPCCDNFLYIPEEKEFNPSLYS